LEEPRIEIQRKKENSAMQDRYRDSIIKLGILLAFAPLLFVRGQTAIQRSGQPSVDPKSFDPHDLLGVWIGDRPKPGKRNFASYDQKIPEPPLTEWGKQHLLLKSISHDALGGTFYPGKEGPGHLCPNNQDPCYSADPNNVTANDPNGDFPGKDCEPLSVPGIYDPLNLAPMTFLAAPGRIVQLFDYHREWRVFWLNRDHPKDLEPTFEGDSTARWDGDTLVVDTVGFNGKTMITQNVGHLKSDAFHVVERYQRVDYDHLVIDITLYDSKAWGDKPWPGFRKYFHLVPEEQAYNARYKTDAFTEWICDPKEMKEYDQRILDQYAKLRLAL
jgi:hypothetical protein